MDFKDLLLKENYYISFAGFENVEDKQVALRVIINGSTSETDLLLAAQGAIETFQIDFPSYASYSATFEDFTIMNENELYQGNTIRIYEKSDFMAYLKHRTNLEEQEISRGKKFRHFSFVCMEHQVDVISCDEPSVKKRS